MPKIIIREIDNTTAGAVEYSNFSVVVPGFLGTPESGYSFDDVADENGIYECSSQSDFIKYVGKKKGNTVTKAAVGASPKNFGTEEASQYWKYLTADEFYQKYQGQDGQAFITTVITKASEKVEGYRVWKYDEDTYYKCEIATNNWSEEQQYIIIEAGNEGQDAVTVKYNGNQIAYELIGLGYTVLFKKIESSIAELDKSTFWSCLKDRATYDFRYICTGDYRNKYAYECICDIAKHNNTETLESTDVVGRGDCIALIDIDEAGFSQSTIVENIQNYVNTNLTGFIDKYAAIFCPEVTYSGKAADVKVYENLTFPASFHYLACAAYAKNKLNFAEWYAVAGYNRGICEKTIAKTSYKIGDIAINALQPRINTYNQTAGTGTQYAVNIIANIRGNYYVWGNRTAEKLHYTTETNPGLVASHFLNIRQLCSTLKKDIYVTCRQLTFDPNSDILWGTFCNAIKPTLEKMKADQGIQDYRIIKVKSTTKALLTAKIRIVPIEAVEDFDISVYLEDSISGTTVAETAE